MPPLTQFKRLDVRPLLARGEEPFPAIRRRVDALKPGEGLILIAPFLPSPLIERLGGEGFQSKVKRCPDPTGIKPVKIELGMTKRVLAAELGTVSETFSRTLAKFREQDLIKVEGKSITVLSPARLTELLRRHLGG
jgi:CRP-like cAMP-binding protein